jgi:hypothetical protein
VSMPHEILLGAFGKQQDRRGEQDADDLLL